MMIAMNKFCKIPSHPEYLVCLNTGVVKNKATGRIRAWFYKDGYPAVKLYGENNRTRTIHSLVVEARGDIVPERCVINHIDGDITNPASENLEIVTHSGNVKHALETGLRKIKYKPICMVDGDSNILAEYENKYEAAEAAHCDPEAIAAACSSKTYKTAGGKLWRYTEDVGKKLIAKKVSRAKAVQSLKNGKVVATFPSAAEAGRILGICDKNITSVCRGDTPTRRPGGYNWRWAKVAKVPKRIDVVPQWPQIKDYPGYLISRSGDVFSKRTKKCLKPTIRNGYYRVSLGDGKGNIRKISVHIEVAKAYIPRIKGKNFVNHIDDNRLNNKVENLEWCTKAENTLKAHDTGAINQRRPVVQIDPETDEIIATFKSVKDGNKVAKSCHVGECCKGERDLAGGYRWKYVDDLEKDTEAED